MSKGGASEGVQAWRFVWAEACGGRKTCNRPPSRKQKETWKQKKETLSPKGYNMKKMFRLAACNKLVSSPFPAQRVADVREKTYITIEGWGQYQRCWATER